MSLANVSIRNKLLAGFGILALMVVIVAAMSLHALSVATDGFSHFVNGVNARADVAAQVRTAVDRRAIAARNLVLVTKPDDIALEKAAALDAQADVSNKLKQLSDMVNSAHDASEKARALVADMMRIEARYSVVAEAIVGMALNNQHAQAIAKLDDDCRPLLAALVGATDAYAEYTRGVQHARVVAYEEEYAAQRAWLLALAAGALTLSALACIFITRAITRPIERAVEVAKTVASGDLTSDIEVTGRDETAELLTALRDMNEHLRETVGRVRNSTSSIGTATKEIAAGNVDLSQRTEEQAASLEETAASMEQITATVRANADNAKQATALAGSASDVARKTSDVVSRVVATMGGIQSSSTKIAEITGIIEGIAFQTNILALNAAVEAARAGEDGRGFAVVASEVRNLAQRSSSAAKEIKELISASVHQIDEGATLAAQAGTTMTEVTHAVERVADIMGEIASASNEQGLGISQINHAISQMDEVTQQNAALVEEAAAASKSLEDQGVALTQAVAFFLLDAHDARARQSGVRVGADVSDAGAAYGPVSRSTPGAHHGAARMPRPAAIRPSTHSVKQPARSKTAVPAAPSAFAATATTANEGWTSF